MDTLWYKYLNFQRFPASFDEEEGKKMRQALLAILLASTYRFAIASSY